MVCLEELPGPGRLHLNKLQLLKERSSSTHMCEEIFLPCTKSYQFAHKNHHQITKHALRPILF